MQIHVRLYASLERYMPVQKEGNSFREVEVDEGSTVEQLLQALHVPAVAVKLIFVNGIHAQIDRILKEGDRLGVFPPVAGG